MKVIILYSGEGKIRELAFALGQGLENKGHQVKKLSAKEAEEHLSLHNYDLLILGSELKGLIRKKVPEVTSRLIRSLKGILGKKSIAFIPSQIIGGDSGLRALMNEMEKEGAFVIDFQIFSGNEEARSFGESL